jgi:8-amino-7-oxononanoate synthase
VIVGEAKRALAISRMLEDKGFLVTAIRPPTVPAGTARLRVTLSAAHEEHQVDALVGAFKEALAT